jgi:hypothetical protein
MAAEASQIIAPLGRSLAGPPKHRAYRFARRRRCGAISLLETTIAVGILGVGLIMVAAVFPVALSQHRDVTEQIRAVELSSKAQAMLQSRLDQTRLWVPSDLRGGQDTPWLLLPSTNLSYKAAAWDLMLALTTTYANAINGVSAVDLSQGLQNPTSLTGLDTLSDRRAPFSNGIQTPPSPFTDSEFANAPNRLAWYGFYRRLGGKFAFCAAICRQQRNQLFVEQDLSAGLIDPSMAPQAQNPYSKPTAVLGADLAGTRRLPVPWRISIGRMVDTTTGENLLSNAATATPQMFGAGLALGRLAPPGSKIMIQGTVRDNSALATPPTIVVPEGRILTVARVPYAASGDFTAVQTVEDIRDLPPFIYGGGVNVTFDVWVFPPALAANELEKNSPLIEWKTSL